MADKPIVLVTGGSGFIGRALIKRLSEHYTAVALDRPDPNGAKRGNFVPIDLGDDQQGAGRGP